jgi:threonyl-tRNA synthetase
LTTNETIGKKIRDAEMQNPFMLIVGEEEEKTPFLSVAMDRKKETSALRLKVC